MEYPTKMRQTIKDRYTAASTEEYFIAPQVVVSLR
jgi:hypothetical protein